VFPLQKTFNWPAASRDRLPLKPDKFSKDVRVMRERIAIKKEGVAELLGLLSQQDIETVYLRLATFTKSNF
jgi:hypothetical protein